MDICVYYCSVLLFKTHVCLCACVFVPLTHGIAVKEQHTVSISRVLKTHIEGMHSIAIHLVLK